MRRRALILLPVLLLAALGAVLVEPVPRPAKAPPGPKPNVVLIVTDDQRWDTLMMMPNVRKLLGNEGVTFENAFVVNALCCPSRASIFTGDRTATHGVWTNAEPYGIWAFNPNTTIATELQEAGYRTAIVGKYFNNYSGSDSVAGPGGVAPGWDRWVVEESLEQPQYYGYTMNVDGVDKTWGKGEKDYATRVSRRFSSSFISHSRSPFFLYWAPIAPHEPATPAPGDRSAGQELEKHRPPSYDEADVSDKPSWLQSEPRLNADARKSIDAFRKRQLVSLISVDREIGELVDALKRKGVLHETLIVFTSDNGMSWGEHRWKGKLVPYEEAIRVPMVLRYDPIVGDADRIEDKLVTNTDIAPTIADLADIPFPADGESLVPLLENPNATWRTDFLIDHERHDVPSYCAVRGERYKFVEYQNGDEELYDLQVDPHELNNLANVGGYAGLRSQLRDRVDELCVPRPPTWG